MAIVKMKHLRLVAMQADREEILHALQRMGCVEIDEPRVDWSDPAWAELGRPDLENLSAARERKSAGEQALEILKRYVTSLSAGDMTVRREVGGKGGALERRAMAMMAPYLRDRNFVFQGVRG